MPTNQVDAAKLTYADYRHLPDDGKRYEIIEGELYVTPSPSTPHQRVAFRLATWVDEFVRARELGEVFMAPLDVVLSDYNVVQPDIIFVSKDRAGLVRQDGIFGAPDLVVEIVSPSTRERDLGVKRHVYLRHGVLEYWVLDVDERTLTVISADSVRTFRGGRIELEQSVLPGIRLDLDELFRQAGLPR